MRGHEARERNVIGPGGSGAYRRSLVAAARMAGAGEGQDQDACPARAHRSPHRKGHPRHWREDRQNDPRATRRSHIAEGGIGGPRGTPWTSFSDRERESPRRPCAGGDPGAEHGLAPFHNGAGPPGNDRLAGGLSSLWDQRHLCDGGPRLAGRVLNALWHIGSRDEKGCYCGGYCRTYFLASSGFCDTPQTKRPSSRGLNCRR